MPSSTEPFILIVDDNPTNLSVLSQSLKSAGYKVRMAMDGEDALEQVGLAHPELILLDIQMPKLDGFEVCRQLQANPETETIPIIFMTALAETEHKVKGLSIGAVDYITKPFEQEEVLARVKVHWRLKQLTDSLEQQVAERSQSLQQTQIQLIQQEKLSTLGQLVAGIGHEINNPLGCIVSNLAPAKAYLTDLTALLDCYQHHYPQPVPAIASQLEDLDLAFTLQDFGALLKSMTVAGDRMKEISESLRNFARSDTTELSPADLQAGLENTLLLLKHRLKEVGDRPAIEIIKHYSPLPNVSCYPGQINQVFMNILANAIDALDSALPARPPKITLTTTVVHDRLRISIADNGIGISETVKANIFDYLFTTKGVGQGTGLGLAIAQQIIVDRHHGKIQVESELNQGTQFTIEIPIRPD
jgi:signal transduction histidine kinase